MLSCTLQPRLSDAEVIQKPDGSEPASARSKLSFSQQMLVYFAGFEALSADVNRHTTLSTPMYPNRTPGLGLDPFCAAILKVSLKVTMRTSG